MSGAGVALIGLGLAVLGSQPVPGRQHEEALEHNLAGEALMQEEVFDAAAREFRKAVELDPLLIIAYYNLGQSWMALRRYPDAEAAYIAARDAIQGMNSLGMRDRAALDRSQKDEVTELKESIVRLQSGQIKGVAIEPTIVKIEQRIRVLESTYGKDGGLMQVPAELSLALGSAYLRQSKLPDAEREYTAAVKTNKQLGAAHSNLAVVYMLTGRYKEARASVQSAKKAGFVVSPQLLIDIDAREAAKP